MEATRTIGIDYSNGIDYAVVTQSCSECKYVFSVENCGIDNSQVSPKSI